ncbi:hypothetical protein AGMMS50212_10360 [Spirochaetia bacterium]|nr:hypothetical protein AGMMS50212_10360 [Spirochaetia bacterium]
MNLKTLGICITGEVAVLVTTVSLAVKSHHKKIAKQHGYETYADYKFQEAIKVFENLLSPKPRIYPVESESA